MPNGPVPAIFKRLFFNEIAVAQQHRALRLIGLQRHRVGCKDIWPVEKIGNLSEPFRLTLSTVGTLRSVEPLERRVLLRVDYHAGLKSETIGDIGDDQLRVCDVILR